MILGDTCTRRCGFCHVKTGKPTWNDPLEPARVARSVARMGLRYAVITSVDRDDLPDKGARIWAATIRQIRRQAPSCKVEVLTPDFQGQEMPLATVIAERPDVFNHNVEVVAAAVPDRAPRLDVRALAAACCATPAPSARARSRTKSGLMVGLGEDHDEMVETFERLREPGVDILTVGQYLRPSERHLPVVRYWHPDEFAALEDGRLRAGLRARRRRPAGALELPRRRGRQARRARRRPASPRRGSRRRCSRSRTTSRPIARRSSPIALIVANVLVYFLWQKGGLSFGSPASQHYLQNLEYGLIPYEPCHPVQALRRAQSGIDLRQPRARSRPG